MSSAADVPMPSGVAAPQHHTGAENLKEMSAAEFICKVGRERNFPRIKAERTGFHPGCVKVKP